MGADTVNAARSMMLALGCIQALSCNTNHCPTGIATQNKNRGRAVKVLAKSARVANFHHATVEAFLELCGALGYDDPAQLSAKDLYVRSSNGVNTWDENATSIEPGQLLTDNIPAPYANHWHSAHWRTF